MPNVCFIITDGALGDDDSVINPAGRILDPGGLLALLGTLRLRWRRARKVQTP